jgi:hypothetical protein
MSTHTPTGFNWAESIQPFADRRERARTVAAFAEYLAQNVHGNSDRALEAMASLAEWCDDDPELLVQARGDLLRETRKASLSAQAVVAQNNRDAVELLELVASAS